MRSYAQIHAMAAERKGGSEALEALLPKALTARKLAAIPDDRWLAGLSRAIFQFGFNWKVIETKWPGFEEAFQGFDLRACAMLNDEALDALLKDTRIVRNPPKVRSVQENAVFLLGLSREHGGVGKLVAGWPSERYVELVDLLKAGGSRVGAQTAQYFLRSMGKESFILSQDVTRALIREGVVAKPPTSARDMRKVQEAFDAWKKESKRSFTEISRTLSLSIESET